MASIKTAKDRRTELEKEGISGKAAEIILKSEGKDRHLARVNSVRDVAFEVGRLICDRLETNQEIETWTEAFAACLIAVDLVGIGEDGGKTDRLPVFSSLGKGRKQAIDGAAWTAAEKDALHGFRGRVIFRAEMPGVLIAAYRLESELGDYDFNIVSIEEVPHEWLRSVARLGLLRSVGKSIPQSDDLGTCGITFDRNVAGWVAVVNALDQTKGG